MDTHFSEPEQALIKLLAEWYESGKIKIRAPVGDQKGQMAPLDEIAERLGVEGPRLNALMHTMEDNGLIAEVKHTQSHRFFQFTIDGRAVQVARSLARKESERPDIVEQIRLSLRRHPWTAWPIRVLLAVVFVATGVNQIVQLLKNLGWL
jgi:hypothetical protein